MRNYHALTLVNILLQIVNLHLRDLLNNEEYEHLNKAILKELDEATASEVEIPF